MNKLAQTSLGAALTVSLLILVHCSSPSDSIYAEDPGDPGGGGPTPNPGDAAPGSPVDAASADGVSPDASGDASRCSAGCAQPPPGSVKCGSGAIDPAKAATACSTLNPVADLHVGAAKDCAAFSITSGRYEVWCGGTSLYVWASFDALASTDVTTCAVSFTLPDGGVATGVYYMLAWDPDYANSLAYFTGTGVGGGMRHGGGHTPDARTNSPSIWHGSVILDGTMTTSGPTPTKGTGTMYFDTVRGSCNGGAPTSSDAIVLAAPVAWEM